MPKARKRKQPLTSTDTAQTSSTPEATRKVIRRFHVLLKKKAQLKAAGIQDDSSIEDEVDALGGLETYQKMSSIGQGSDRGGGSEAVLIKWLRDRHYNGRTSKLLEVGALRPDNFRSCASWLDVTSIDLHSRHPSIKEQDFLLMSEAENAASWDIISLSLVLNFVPEPRDRGRMLRLACSMLVQDGLLFVALPQPCVTNSRYLTMEHFRSAMILIGMEQAEIKWKPGGKMVYWLFRKTAPPGSAKGSDNALYKKKTVLLTGHRNNFCILF